MMDVDCDGDEDGDDDGVRLKPFSNLMPKLVPRTGSVSPLLSYNMNS